MRKAARRESAKAWLDSGAQITVKRYARRYGVDRYTAREDLEAGRQRLTVRESPDKGTIESHKGGGQYALTGAPVRFALD